MSKILIAIDPRDYRKIQNALSNDVQLNMQEAKKGMPAKAKYTKLERFRHFERLANISKDLLDRLEQNSMIL